MVKQNMVIKIADKEDEFNQIRRLSYQTFVEEIPQHPVNDQKSLRDKFHDKNIYIIAKHNSELLGMICINGERPFSLDQKLPNLDQYLPEFVKICEIRLLSIKKKNRGGKILLNLLQFLEAFALNAGYDFAIISGTTRQIKLYSHLGFKAFGPLLGEEDAQYQPMYISKAQLKILNTPAHENNA